MMLEYKIERKDQVIFKINEFVIKMMNRLRVLSFKNQSNNDLNKVKNECEESSEVIEENGLSIYGGLVSKLYQENQNLTILRSQLDEY